MPDARSEVEQVIALRIGRVGLGRPDAVHVAALAAALLDGPDAPCVLTAQWDEDCRQQFDFGTAHGRDLADAEWTADLAPLLALHRGDHYCQPPPEYGDETYALWRYYGDQNVCPTVAALPERIKSEAQSAFTLRDQDDACSLRKEATT